MQVRKSDVYFLCHKAATTVAYIAMLVLTVRFFHGRLDWQFAAGCTILSAFWCLLTLLKMHHFLLTYFDVFSRLEVLVPVGLGLVLSVVPMFSPARSFTHVADGAEVLFWLALYVKYRANKKQFEKMGHGFVPDGTWVSPPAKEIEAGDLVLTNGAVAADLHEAVGHAFLVLERGGEKLALSSHMDSGCTLAEISEALGEVQGGYIVLKLSNGFSKEKNAQAVEIAEDMVRRNRAWKRNRTRKWHEFVDRVFAPFPFLDAVRIRIRQAYKCTGYDWLGMLMGRIAPDNWTCIGAAIALYHQVGVHTQPYGTGLLGFGTTLLDPIMPVRFLNDPAFELLKVPDARKQHHRTIMANSKGN